MVDGTIARKLNSVTVFGSKLDSVADLVFIIAACIKVLPVVQLPGWIWCWVFVIAAMRFSKGKLLLEHTVWNKVTGFLLVTNTFCTGQSILVDGGESINYNFIWKD